MKLGSTPLSIMNFFHMLLLAGILSIQPDLFEQGDSQIYAFLLDAAPQKVYTGVAFGTALLFVLAFIFKQRHVEIIALLVAGAYFVFILASYVPTFPTMASASYLVWTLATFMSIVDVIYAMAEEKKTKRFEKRKEFY